VNGVGCSITCVCVVPARTFTAVCHTGGIGNRYARTTMKRDSKIFVANVFPTRANSGEELPEKASCMRTAWPNVPRKRQRGTGDPVAGTVGACGRGAAIADLGDPRSEPDTGVSPVTLHAALGTQDEVALCNAILVKRRPTLRPH
jgi:hypothetical protein